MAPAGKLRAAINFGNPVLATRGANGEPQGVSVDLAREAARRLGLPVELVPFNSAGSVAEAIKARQVDLAFVAIDPVRAANIEYTAPYVIIEGAYLVRNAAGVPKGRIAGQRWLARFIEDMKASGFVASALRRHGIEGATVAPPRPAPNSVND